jgi:hypothetical protein
LPVTGRLLRGGQNDPNALPNPINAMRAINASTIATMTMSK